MSWALEAALDGVERLNGWRAFLMLPPDAADADAVAGALPWVQQGTARSGTVVRLISHHGGLILVTGGALSDEEGAHLFDIRDKLQDLLTSAYIIPPPSAAPELIVRMYISGLAPSLPTTKLPNTRGFAAIGTALLFVAFWASRARAFVVAVPAAMLAAVCGIISWLNKSKINGIQSDPVYLVSTRWAVGLPARPRR